MGDVVKVGAFVFCVLFLFVVGTVAGQYALILLRS